MAPNHSSSISASALVTPCNIARNTRFWNTLLSGKPVLRPNSNMAGGHGIEETIISPQLGLDSSRAGFVDSGLTRHATGPGNAHS
ncbi:uncharacterized protein L3040_001773 [Drepanopeziza brunnea f. sp. 'multigermtubi']|uniref:uncharacterized protein n=1 Tax=Drepanopeziza brunnea f. sp. 'multigermtubi' TaxID=698441 RepID=UPI0023954040|nr:hypothetical protein L3040_001773 [Drepanopeziza brunnea f. sp. 'multigermtubi']